MPDEKEPILTTVDRDVICPECFTPLGGGLSISNAAQDRYGLFVRTYGGWCNRCHMSIKVEQFRRRPEDRWRIHRWQYWSPYAGEADKIGSRVGSDLPEPPLVVTGQGGDYDRGHDDPLGDIIRKLKKMKRQIDGVLRDVARLRGNMDPRLRGDDEK